MESCQLCRTGKRARKEDKDAGGRTGRSWECRAPARRRTSHPARVAITTRQAILALSSLPPSWPSSLRGLGALSSSPHGQEGTKHTKRRRARREERVTAQAPTGERGGLCTARCVIWWRATFFGISRLFLRAEKPLYADRRERSKTPRSSPLTEISSSMASQWRPTPPPVIT